MAIEVFNRHEKKYRLSGAVFERLQGALAEYLEADAHNQRRFTYQIRNLYYDTDDDYLIRTSLGKPAYKEKLRVRAYGPRDLDAKVYVEIKKKFRGVVNKRRSGMRLGEAYAFLETGTLPEVRPYMNGQVLREIGYLLSRYEPRPKVLISYERRALVAGDGSDLRVSFDTNILTRRHDLCLEAGVYGEPLLAPGEWLMEIKTPGGMPLWLTGLLSEYEIFPVGFSKYGTEYMRRLAGGSVDSQRYAPPGQARDRPRLRRVAGMTSVASLANKEVFYA